MRQFYEAVRKRKKLFLVIAYGYTIFNGCFIFPIYRHLEPSFYLMTLFAYISISLIYVSLFKKKPIRVFISTLFLTAVGLIGRYFLEYGEVSNTINFTTVNMTVFLTAVPLIVTLAYMIIPKFTQVD